MLFMVTGTKKATIAIEILFNLIIYYIYYIKCVKMLAYFFCFCYPYKDFVTDLCERKKSKPRTYVIVKTGGKS